MHLACHVIFKERVFLGSVVERAVKLIPRIAALDNVNAHIKLGRTLLIKKNQFEHVIYQLKICICEYSSYVIIIKDKNQYINS